MSPVPACVRWLASQAVGSCRTVKAVIFATYIRTFSCCYVVAVCSPASGSTSQAVADALAQAQAAGNTQAVAQTLAQVGYSK